MLAVPNIRETTLDDVFVQTLIPNMAPRILASGAVVRLDVHNIGGIRQFRKWEIADIAIIVYVIMKGQIIARKIGLLQAKRLFPKNGDVTGSDPIGFSYGLNAHLHPEESPTSMLLARAFSFDMDCSYSSLKSESNQIVAMKEFEAESGQVVFYLLYNPPSVPTTVAYPVGSQPSRRVKPTLGCRVVSSATVNDLLKSKKPGQSLSLAEVDPKLRPRNESRLEYWVADLLLRCRVGRQFKEHDEESILPLVERRSGPIGASIAVNIELPDIKD